MLQTATIQRVWVYESSRNEGLGRKAWEYGWGLLFVVVMTLLSVAGPPTAYAKLPPDPPAAIQPSAPAVK